MRRLVFRTAAFTIFGTIGMMGCGKPTTPAPPVTTTRPAVTTTMPSNPSQQPANTSGSTAKPKSGAGEKKSNIPANADPKTVFAIAGLGRPMDIIGKNGQLPSDNFEVAYADPQNDSTKFTVDSIKPSTQPQPLIGSGKPKPGFVLPKGFTEFKATGYSNDGLPMRIVNTKTGTQLGLVPGGTAIVGTDQGPDECMPSFTVLIDTFYMEILEVTVQDYEKYRAELKERKKPAAPAPSNPSSAPKSPVLGVSWAGAQAYAKWNGMELPTESEFEKAARGPNGLRTPWGDGKSLWGNRTMTVTGSYPADSSPYGILDLAGNAKEWCADLYSPTAHAEAAAAANKDTLHNWAGPKKVRDMSLRVVKGNGQDWSAWHREGKDMQKPHLDIGFRCVLRIPPEPKASATTKATP